MIVKDVIDVFKECFTQIHSLIFLQTSDSLGMFVIDLLFLFDCNYVFTKESC